MNQPAVQQVPFETATLAETVIHDHSPAAPLPADSTDDAAASYSTLSAAVAAQPVDSNEDAELRCLAIGVYYEAKGEPLAGQLAVAKVILNRTSSGRFPASVCSVLTQPHQFSFVRRGRLPRVREGAAWRRAIAVAEVARKDLWESPADDALYFHARYVKPRWGRPRVAQIGNHIFYR